MGMLGEFLLALNDAFQDSDVSEVVNILDHLSKTSRFSLSIKFLSQKEQQAVSFTNNTGSFYTTSHTVKSIVYKYNVMLTSLLFSHCTCRLVNCLKSSHSLIVRIMDYPGRML